MAISINENGVAIDGVTKIPMDINDTINNMNIKNDNGIIKDFDGNIVQQTIYGSVYGDPETFTISSGKVDFVNADYQDDPFNIITLADTSLDINKSGLYVINTACTINTDRTAIGDGAGIAIYKNGSDIGRYINGGMSAAGSSDSGEELMFNLSIVVKLEVGDKITFALTNLTNDYTVTLNYRVNFFSLEVY